MVDRIYNFWWQNFISKSVTDQKKNSLNSGQIHMKDVQCAETIEK